MTNRNQKVALFGDYIGANSPTVVYVRNHISRWYGANPGGWHGVPRLSLGSAYHLRSSSKATRGEEWKEENPDVPVSYGNPSKRLNCRRTALFRGLVGSYDQWGCNACSEKIIEDLVKLVDRQGLELKQGNGTRG